MKKVLFIMAAALMTMTQCKKQEIVPAAPAADTIKMTVTAGSGAKTDINTETGSITWSAGDKLYVSDGTNWLGSLTLIGEGGSAQGTFTGSIAGIDETETTCHFFYLGHDNGMEEPTGTAAANISLASQDGTLAGAMKYHAGYGRTDVTVESGEYEGYVLMNTKIAIAHINFTTDGTTAYTGSVTMGGTGISNTMTVNPDGTFSGSGEGGIVIGGTTGERYVTLIPTAGTNRVDVAFTGDATGSMTFLAGISENKFYGMKDAMTVTVTEPSYLPGEFSVSGTTKVKFSKGNLWADATDAENPVFHFEEHQWDFQLGVKNVDEWGSGKWEPSHVIHFYWSKNAKVAVAEDYYWEWSSSDVFFTNDTETTANPDFQVAGETAGTWRTLSEAEGWYLLNQRNNASRLRALVTLEDVHVDGLVILPDDSDATASQVTTTDLVASSGAVFLPCSGFRSWDGGDLYSVGQIGNSWLSTPDSEYEESAFFIYFEDGDVGMNSGNVSNGHPVRLVRDVK